MGFFDAAKAAYNGNRAYHLHVDANKLAGEGKVAQAKEKYQAALKLYDEAVRQGNNAPNIVQAYTLLLMREGEFEKARALLEEMSRRKGLSDGEWAQLRLQYSICLWHAGELDRAIETINRAAAYRMNGAIYGTLGMYRVEKAKVDGDFQSALDFNLEALDYDDEDPSTLDNLGQLYEHRRRDYPRALEYALQSAKYPDGEPAEPLERRAERIRRKMTQHTEAD